MERWCGSPGVTLGLGPTWALSANAYLEANPSPLSLFPGLSLSWHRVGVLQHGVRGSRCPPSRQNSMAGTDSQGAALRVSTAGKRKRSQAQPEPRNNADLPRDGPGGLHFTRDAKLLHVPRLLLLRQLGPLPRVPRLGESGLKMKPIFLGPPAHYVSHCHFLLLT